MKYECIEVSVEAGIAHVQLNQPQRLNSMTPAFWAEIPHAFRALDEVGGVRVAILSSTGKHFSAGMDLSVFQGGGSLGTKDVLDRERFRQQLRKLQESFNAIANARFPVIAAIQGGCSGGCNWMSGESLMMDGAGALGMGGNFYELRNWKDEDWQAARDSIEVQNKKDRAQRT